EVPGLARAGPSPGHGMADGRDGGHAVPAPGPLAVPDPGRAAGAVPAGVPKRPAAGPGPGSAPDVVVPVRRTARDVPGLPDAAVPEGAPGVAVPGAARRGP